MVKQTPPQILLKLHEREMETVIRIYDRGLEKLTTVGWGDMTLSEALKYLEHYVGKITYISIESVKCSYMWIRAKSTWTKLSSKPIATLNIYVRKNGDKRYVDVYYKLPW